MWLKAQQQQAQIAIETALAKTDQPNTAESPTNKLGGEDTSMRPPKEVVVTTVDNQSERDDFLLQCVHSEATSATDHLKQLLETRLATGGEVHEVIDMITQRAVQQALAQAAFDLPFKRKDRHTHDDDASTLASVQEAGTNTRMFFPTMKAPADRSQKALGPPALHTTRGGERFDPAALVGRRMPQSDVCADPANKSSIPAASYAEKERMVVAAGVNMRTSVQDNFLPVTKSWSFLIKELLPQAANMLQQFQDKIERSMNEPRLWVHSDVLYTMVTDKKPFINGAFVGLFISNIWSLLHFTSGQCDLSKSMHLFLWHPADQQSQQYAKEEGDVVTEQNDAPMSQGKAKIGRSVPVLAKCTEARDVISALLWMAATVALSPGR